MLQPLRLAFLFCDPNNHFFFGYLELTIKSAGKRASAKLVTQAPNSVIRLLL
jgi:hypothetical protein